MEIIKSAIKKIDTELKNFKGSPKATAIKTAVADALKSFCEQEEEFAQAIIQSDKTLADCCEHVVKGCGNCISDLKAYSKAVQFYFNIATIHFNMGIDLSGGNGAEPKPITVSHNSQQSEPVAVPDALALKKTQSLTMSLDDLLDF